MKNRVLSSRALLTAALLATALSAATAPAAPPSGPAAAGLAVAPVFLNLTRSARAVSTIVSNPGAAAITVQARLFAWTTNGEEDVYTAAQDIGLSPPIFRLAAGAAQSVRLVALVPPGAVERSYRLMIDQLPIEDAPGQLQMPVRMVLPVFVPPAEAGGSPELEWSARFDRTAKRVVVRVVNRGAVHARIVDLGYLNGTGLKPIASGLAGYALAGGTREWSFAVSAPPERLTIVAGTDRAEQRATVSVAQ